jgi:outer membrane protein
MKLLVSINVLLIAVIVFFCFHYYNSSKRIVYVNTGDVFNAFQMTKEADKEIKAIEEKKQSIIDSLAGIIQKVQARIITLADKDFDYLKRDFVTKRGQFSEDIAKLKQGNVDKIWKQINQYIADYGKENDIDIILGANGQGSLMFAKDKIDISKDVSNYINNKYNGLR